MHFMKSSSILEFLEIPEIPEIPEILEHLEHLGFLEHPEHLEQWYTTHGLYPCSVATVRILPMAWIMCIGTVYCHLVRGCCYATCHGLYDTGYIWHQSRSAFSTVWSRAWWGGVKMPKPSPHFPPIDASLIDVSSICIDVFICPRICFDSISFPLSMYVVFILLSCDYGLFACRFWSLGHN